MLFDTLNCIDFHVHGLNIRVLCETNFLTIRIFGFYQVTTDFSVQKEASFVTIKKQDFLAIIAPESFSDGNWCVFYIQDKFSFQPICMGVLANFWVKVHQ